MKLILFDFDGVLVNTNELSYQIHKIKNKDLTWQTFQGYLTGNFFEKMREAVKGGKHIPPDDYYGEYNKGLNNLTIEEALHNLILTLSVKYKIAIISSTISSYIKGFIKKEKLSGCFADIWGADHHLSKTFKIKNIIEKYNLSPENAIYITDTTGDMIEARASGVECIGVSWGLHDKEDLLEERPFAVVDTPEELEEKIEEFFK